MDECQLGVDNCDGNAECINSIGSYECICKSGLTGDGTVCNGKLTYTDSHNYCMSYLCWC